MVIRMEQLGDEYLSHAVDLVKVENELRRVVTRNLRSLREQLMSKLMSIDPTEPGPARWKRQRVEKLFNQTSTTINSIYKGMRTESDEFLTDFARVEADYNVNMPNQILRAPVLSTSLSAATIRELGKSTLIEGASSREWWTRQERAVRAKFEDQIRQGMLAGEHLGQLRQRIRGVHTGKFRTYRDSSGVLKRAGIFRGGVMGATTQQADALARTSVQAVNNQVRQEVYKANDDVVGGSEWLATLDNRTTDICRALDGERWDHDYKPLVKGMTYPGPTAHWGERSTTIPWLLPLEAISGGKLKTIPDETRASIGGQVPAKTSYNDWFKKQPEADQLEILGPTKLRLYKQNSLSFRDMVKGSGVPLTIGQLETKIARKGFKPFKNK